jgi:hypothetical protein
LICISHPVQKNLLKWIKDLSVRPEIETIGGEHNGNSSRY